MIGLDYWRWWSIVLVRFGSTTHIYCMLAKVAVLHATVEFYPHMVYIHRVFPHSVEAGPGSSLDLEKFTIQRPYPNSSKIALCLPYTVVSSCPKSLFSCHIKSETYCLKKQDDVSIKYLTFSLIMLIVRGLTSSTLQDKNYAVSLLPCLLYGSSTGEDADYSRPLSQSSRFRTSQH